MTTEEIKSKMQELILKWKDVPEAEKYSAEWFRRRADRSYYIKLKSIIREKEHPNPVYEEARKIFGFTEED